MQDDSVIAGDYDIDVAVGPDAGDLALTGPTVDLDGDGVLDTRVFGDDAGVTVATDVDGDGFVDHLTRVARDGAYAAWEPTRDADGTVRWQRTDDGAL